MSMGLDDEEWDYRQSLADYYEDDYDEEEEEEEEEEEDLWREEEPCLPALTGSVARGWVEGRDSWRVSRRSPIPRALPFLDGDQDLGMYSGMTEEAALVLGRSGRSFSVYLENLSVGAAMNLVQRFDGQGKVLRERQVALRGLTCLSDQAASWLAEFIGALAVGIESPDGLVGQMPSGLALAYLAGSSSITELSISGPSGWLDVRQALGISSAGSSSNSRGPKELIFYGVTTLTAEVVQGLNGRRYQEIGFPDLYSISLGVARQMGAIVCDRLWLGTTEITAPQLRAILAGTGRNRIKRLALPRVRHVSAQAVNVLASLEEVYFGSLDRASGTLARLVCSQGASGDSAYRPGDIDIARLMRSAAIEYQPAGVDRIRGHCFVLSLDDRVLSSRLATALCPFKGVLRIPRINSLDGDTALALAGYSGLELLLGIKTLSASVAGHLFARAQDSKHAQTLIFSRLETLEADLAGCFSRYSGGQLSLPALRDLTDDAAAALADYRGNLHLGGVERLGTMVCQTLSKAKCREIHLAGLQDMSEAEYRALYPQGRHLSRIAIDERFVRLYEQ